MASQVHILDSSYDRYPNLVGNKQDDLLLEIIYLLWQAGMQPYFLKMPKRHTLISHPYTFFDILYAAAHRRTLLKIQFMRGDLLFGPLSHPFFSR